jgi:hypothetical protein
MFLQVTTTFFKLQECFTMSNYTGYNHSLTNHLCANKNNNFAKIYKLYLIFIRSVEHFMKQIGEQ